MSDIPEYNEENMRLFWKCMEERHNIYKKRLAGDPPPWTEDPIYQQFKFTNICRELDIGTKFVTQRIDKYAECQKSYLFNVMAYRLFNKIETLDFIYKNYQFGVVTHDNYCKDSVEELVRMYGETESVWTNAFIVTGFSNLPKEWDKIKRVCHALDLLADNICDEDTDFKTLEEAYKWVKKQLGFGEFLAYQTIIDLSYGDWYSFCEDQFVICGPGCKRGLDRLFPHYEVAKYGYESLNFWLRDNQYAFYEDYGIDYKTLFDDREYPYLTVMSVENLLCEFSKYMKAHNKEGRPRNKYIQSVGSSSNNYSHWLSNNVFNVYSKIDMQQTPWSKT